jgi:isopenicillin-N N-acyltransferase-like protein
VTTTDEFPRIRVSGGSRTRGWQYGTQAREQILRGRDGYERAFAQAAGWTWTQAVESAVRLIEPVASAYPDCLEEIAGIADGAGLDFDDVFTMNARTEVLWSATARQAADQRARFARECSSFALLPFRTATGHTYLGQNWDWLAHAFDTLVVLEVEQPDKPNFVTIVEAGLLAKASMNSAGLGVAVNALVTSSDHGGPGLPFHILLRAFADCESLAEAIHVATNNTRASSGNYLLASADGAAVNLETTPGDYRGVVPRLPERGALVHTNHFVTSPTNSDDLAHYAMADSLVRLQRVQTSIADAAKLASVQSLHDALSDHADFPSSVCSHPDLRKSADERWATVMSVIMDLDAREIHLSDGNPCQSAPRRLTFDGLLTKQSELAALRLEVDNRKSSRSTAADHR